MGRQTSSGVGNLGGSPGASVSGGGESTRGASASVSGAKKGFFASPLSSVLHRTSHSAGAAPHLHPDSTP
eukprot:1860792-Prymnesium_polylepis.1